MYEKAKAWLEELGYDLETEHTRMAPYRLSWYVMCMLADSKSVHITAFDNVNPRVEDMVIVPAIPVFSCCSHHLLPFFGYVDFGYIPGDKILGLSKIPGVIQAIAKGAWMQEHLTHAIADKFTTSWGRWGSLCV